MGIDTNRDSSVPPAIISLMELHKICPEVFGQIEIYIDGGVTRGTDIVKALALGATAVGIGRPFLYSLAYGSDGVEHLISSKLSVRRSKFNANCECAQF